VICGEINVESNGIAALMTLTTVVVVALEVRGEVSPPFDIGVSGDGEPLFELIGIVVVVVVVELVLVEEILPSN
jgi:hypothetical protein